mmetsp:Transcript_42185/g.80719  ORF Transcript_42185/g.80719 Transcript_42185/m.80719 type:complete len:333 (+) Transcript_42185:1-999(+)
MDLIQDDVEGEAVEDDMLHQSIPYFILGQTVIALLWWTFASLYIFLAKDSRTFLSNKAGLDTISPGWSDLRLNDGECNNLRVEVWRSLAYQWTHVGISHILVNCCMNLILGIPLEGLHGHFRIAMMYNIGVFGGSCCYWVGDTVKSVVGMSGGCYSLIGMHYADLMMNWSEMKFRKPILFVLCLLVLVDATAYLLSVGSENASHTAHVGGAVAGLIIGVVAGKNIKTLQCEKVFRAFVMVLGFILMAFSIVWLIVQNPPRSIIQSIGQEHLYCWVRQIYDPSRFGDGWQCVQCDSLECVDSYADVAPERMKTVDISECPNFYFEGNYRDTAK